MMVQVREFWGGALGECRHTILYTSPGRNGLTAAAKENSASVNISLGENEKKCVTLKRRNLGFDAGE